MSQHAPDLLGNVASRIARRCVEHPLEFFDDRREFLCAELVSRLVIPIHQCPAFPSRLTPCNRFGVLNPGTGTPSYCIAKIILIFDAHIVVACPNSEKSWLDPFPLASNRRLESFVGTEFYFFKTEGSCRIHVLGMAKC